MQNIKTIKAPKKVCTFITTIILILTTCITAFAADSKYKLSDIDLIVTIPDELVCFTRSTTNNNAYLEKIGIDSAAELRASMISANVYLEAVNSDITYEVVISSQTASSELADFNTIDSDKANELLEEYIEQYKHTEADAFTEDITASKLYKYNDIYYFETDITNVSKTMVTVYSKKYYTVMQGKVYTFSIQSKTDTVSNDMSDMLLKIVNSAEYTPLKKSVFENSLVIELLSSIITVGVPIAILALIAYLLKRTKKKSAKQIAKEEEILRKKYVLEEAEKSKKQQ